ncbi:MAG: site-2 protease family protein [Negativicutes bacterium]|nr:site-2 protease family protein [Negativicutes bacterium]
MFALPSVEKIIYMLPAFVIAISCHEFAHAWVANQYGDPTAKNHGRLTLNPLSHFDLFGFFLFVFVGLGWAKGVPVNSYNFKGNRRVAMIAVSLAGVTVNFMLAILALIIQCLLVLGVQSGIVASGISTPLITVFHWMFTYNVIFGVFNLLPIPPLDGSKVLAALLPGEFEDKIAAVDRFGFLILFGLLWIGWLDKVLWPLIDKVSSGLYEIIVPIFFR